MNGETPLEFEVIGRVHKVAKEYIVLTTWGHANQKDNHDENTNCFTILLAVLTECERLVPHPPPGKSAPH